MAFRLNLDRSLKSAVFGSVQAFLNWAEDGQGDTEPALYFRKANGGRELVCVRMSEVAGYMNSNGYAMITIVSLSSKIAGCLGFARTDSYAVKNVADALLEWAEDLIKAPPLPDSPIFETGGPANAVARMRINGEVVAEQEVSV